MINKIKYLKNFLASFQGVELAKIRYANRFESGVNGDFITYDVDALLSAAYQYYCTSQIPQIIGDDHGDIFSHVFKCYELGVRGYDNHPRAPAFVGKGWAEIAKKFGEVLRSNPTHFMKSYGARGYKTLGASNDPFGPEHRKAVSDALNMWKYIGRKYDLADTKYKGFSDLYYPHFEYEGNVFNRRLYDLETALFVKHKGINPGIIAEIGAGDGGVSRELVRATGAKYIIFDLPEILTRSQLFLSVAFAGERKIGGLKDLEEAGGSIAAALKDLDILCLPGWLVGEIDVEIDLWVNTHSLGEMPIDVSRAYCDVINRTGKSFLSVNDTIDRDCYGFHIHGSTRYLDKLTNFKLVHTDCPVSSNYPQYHACHMRHLFKAN